MNKITVDITLDAKEYKALKVLAHNDHMSIEEEARILFRLQLREEMELEEAKERGEQ